jgi:hypothetical protein
MQARNAELQEQLQTAIRDGLQAQSAAFERYAGLIHQPLTSEQFDEIRDATFGAHVRSVSYALRLLREGADARGPNSRRTLLQGLTGIGPTLHRAR